MRNRIIAASLTLSMLFMPGTASADPAPEAQPSPSGWSSPWSRTRPLSPGAIALIEEASARSAIIETQLDELERTDLMVYVSDSMPGVFNGPKSSLVILTNVGGVRYLWIRINVRFLSPTERISALGHELQHALEVAAAPEVTDGESMAALYRRIGWETAPNRFESSEAQAVAIRVRKQLFEREKAARVARSGTGAGAVPSGVGSAQP